jgi:hypothetical protein
MARIVRGHKALKSQLDKYCGELGATWDREKVSSDLSGFWQQKATELTWEVLEMSGRYTERGAEEDEDPLAPLRKAMEGIADLAQALTRLEVEPNEANLRSFGREMNEAKGSMMSLDRVLMLSQDPALVACAHELVTEAEEALRGGQQRVRVALQRIGSASDASEASSMARGPVRSSQPAPGGGERACRGALLLLAFFLSGGGQKQQGGTRAGQTKQVGAVEVRWPI